MSVGLFAKKIGMTQIFDDSGVIFPVTLLKTEECQISQIKTLLTQKILSTGLDSISLLVFVPILFFYSPLLFGVVLFFPSCLFTSWKVIFVGGGLIILRRHSPTSLFNSFLWRPC